MTKKSDKDISDANMLFDYGIHVPSQTIILTGEVDADMYETLIMGLTVIESYHKDKTNITVELNSLGGDWYTGIGIHDRIKACKFPVTIRVAGTAMSMASVILQSADKRLITPGSTVMVHDGSEVIAGSPENVLIWAKHSKEICDYMYKIYADASGKSTSYWSKKCKKDFILNAEDAIKMGLADGFIK